MVEDLSALANNLTPHMLDRLLHRSRDTFDYDNLAALAASLDSASFAANQFADVTRYPSDDAMLRDLVRTARPNGLFLEFGVATGRTLRIIAEEISGTVYGFDSFGGLPETWRPGYPAGMFAQQPPETLPNVELVVGLFNNTLPGFLVRHREPVSFLHVDCDLYSSTMTVLTALSQNIIPGTIIVFDEFLNYPGWRVHEYKAWDEFTRSRNIRFQYIGCVPSHQQVAVRVL